MKCRHSPSLDETMVLHLTVGGKEEAGWPPPVESQGGDAGYGRIRMGTEEIAKLCASMSLKERKGSVRRLNDELKDVGEVREVDVEPSGDCLGKFLRVQVAIEIDKPLRRILLVDVLGDGEETVSPIQYERLPNFYFRCGMLGHTSYDVVDERGSFDSLLSLMAIVLYRRLNNVQKGGCIRNMGGVCLDGVGRVNSCVNGLEGIPLGSKGPVGVIIDNGPQMDVDCEIMGAGKSKASFTEEGIGHEKPKYDSSETGSEFLSGVGNLWAFRCLTELKKGFNPDIVFLMETKATHSLMKLYRVRLGFAGKFVINNYGKSGG
ncbi:hypothetical protein Dsin_012732 [Dipteronia sinensis]|uniref:Uncharacterized protein n=1 Tax=Dipteronia sinensis TaxID=43782 RepID=A0AAE0AIM5_9ROSI|nr:hypothetical protein Dsin_012732 [Dipteronia sinensis]